MVRASQSTDERKLCKMVENKYFSSQIHFNYAN